MLLSSLGTALGLAMLVGGANWLIDGAAGLARKVGISGHLIGVTLVATATSLPELATSITATLTGHDGIAIGNVVGSNAFNVGVVLAVGVIILPIKSDRMVVRDGYAVLIATGIFFLAAFGGIGRFEALVILIAYVAYTVYLFRATKLAPEMDDSKRPLPVLIALTVLGMVFLFGGSPLLVESATGLASVIGVDDTVIGLTIIALGTSLPELLTAVVAAVKGHEGIAIGNVLGSNLFNILLIIGVSGLISPLEMTRSMYYGIVPAMMLITLMGVILSRRTMGRKEGLLLLTGYMAFLVLTIT